MGIYYGHYKAHYLSLVLSSVKYVLVNIAVENSQPLERWYSRVSVIIEKSKGVVEVSKLRAILLLEADLNTLYKILFNTRVILLIEKKQQISYEIIGGRRGYSALHIALNKKLVSDIANQYKAPIVVISLDTTNYYNKIAHPITSLTC